MLRTILASAALAISVPAMAAVPMYPNPGTANPVTYNFSAVSNGDLVVYYAGASATINNAIGIQVNSGPLRLSSLSNASALGASYNFGPVNAGDRLMFWIRSAAPGGHNYFYSDSAQNTGGVNHVWSTSYAGGDYGIPAGTLVAFEDIPRGGDLDYNDISFVFTNVSNGAGTPNGAVPEPATWAMMIGGFGLIGASMRRRSRIPVKVLA